MKANIIDFVAYFKEKDDDKSYAFELISHQLMSDCADWYNNVFGKWGGDKIIYLDDIPEDKVAAHLIHALLEASVYRYSTDEAGDLDFSPPDPELLATYLRDKLEDEANDFLCGMMVGFFIARDISRQKPGTFQSKSVDQDFDEYVRSIGA